MEKESVTYLLRKIVKKVHVYAGRQLVKDSLNFPQYQVLMLLNYKEKLSMSEVKKELMISHSGATNLIDKLVKKSLIKRYYSSNDRRKVMIALTKNGEGVLEKLLSSHEEFVGHLSAKIGKEGLETVKKALKIFLKFINTYVEE